ncbi:MAG: N-acetylneuraminate synthase family protein, partial [Sedimentisphaerales bacterium]|nr:N-acetylneuraminate synthase family protein [Sedimentisphaerales bacterium]
LTTGAVAVAAGAVILEKHFTLDKNLQGPDHKMSLDPEGLKKICWVIKNDHYEISKKQYRLKYSKYIFFR